MVVPPYHAQQYFAILHVVCAFVLVYQTLYMNFGAMHIAIK